MRLEKKNRRIIKDKLSPILKYIRPGNIVMYHLGRCGSKVLGSMISQTKGIYWHGEIFSRLLRDLHQINKKSNSTVLHKNNFINSNFNNDQYWDLILSEIGIDENGIIYKKYNKQIFHFISNYMKISGRHYYGFEFKPFNNRVLNIEMEDFIIKLKTMGISHFIILDRKNRLRKIISSLIAHQFPNKWHSNTKDEVKLKEIIVNPDRIEIDFESKPLINYLEDYDDKFGKLSQTLEMEKKILKLFYEDDIQTDPNMGYNKVCTFLGVEMGNKKIPLKPTNPFPLKSIVKNFNDLEAYLKYTSYEWMLYN